MSIESFLSVRYRQLTLVVLSVISLTISAVRTDAGSLVIPAWSFARGNAQVLADPQEFANAGPIVNGGPEQSWGWSVAYDIELPVAGNYDLQICYAAAEARPVRVFFDGQEIGKCCLGVTCDSSGATWNSSAAKWEGIYENHPWRKLQPIAAGRHTIKLLRSGPLPHLVALRLDTDIDFPPEWIPPRYEVRDLDSIPVAYRGAITKSLNLPPPVEDTSNVRPAGSLEISACTFDRGEANIYANPDRYADAGPLVGGGNVAPETTAIEYDIDFPVTTDYTLEIRYAAAIARPCDVWLDGRHIGRACMGISIGTRPSEYPIRFSWTSRNARWEGLHDPKQGKLVKLSVTKGQHTLKISRVGPLPHIAALRLNTTVAFPKEWQAVERRVDLRRVAPRYRSVFLPPDAVNIAALKLAIQGTMATYGSRYAEGERYLKELFALEASMRAMNNGDPERIQAVEDSLSSLRNHVILNHPELKFDKLLFLKRPVDGYGHTYADQHGKEIGGSLCVLSPVSPDGKVTPLVPELEGGLFDRFDLSYDGTKVVFAYRQEDTPFRIYEIDIDPKAGRMIPGSLRQLTFGGEEEIEAIRCQVEARQPRRFHDMDPIYLPNGKIMFTSTRAQRIVFCAPGASVTTLYLMDGDGENLHRISESPVNETAPSVLDDGRVIYTRWEYIDKGLGNGQGLWALRPDGSGSDHIYKNNTLYPAGMSNARSIPGSRKIVTVGGNHHHTAVGPVVLVDARRSRRTTDAMECITPEIGYPPSMGYPDTGFGTFMDPYPLSEKTFLVSYRPQSMKRDKAGYGLYVLDAWGNRAELYRDPELACFEPVPLRPRMRPTEIATIVQADQKETATLYIQNIYEGMTGIERGRVKYVRVMGALEWPWDQNGIAWSLGTDPHRKKIYGLAKVHQDGSAYFTVPSEKNIFFQALDENFMSLQHMPTFVNLMPGEQRGCIGCHELRRKAPAASAILPLALHGSAQPIQPQPGDTGARMVDFTVDVQSTLDRHCVRCHSGNDPTGNLDLVGIPQGKFSRSFDNLVGSGLVSYRACNYGAAHFLALPPLTHGSHRSKLIEQIRHAPCKAKLTREEFIKIVTWIDANIPYYGTYRGLRDRQDKDHPDFRALPLAEY